MYQLYNTIQLRKVECLLRFLIYFFNSLQLSSSIDKENVQKKYKCNYMWIPNPSPMPRTISREVSYFTLPLVRNRRSPIFYPSIFHRFSCHVLYGDFYVRWLMYNIRLHNPLLALVIHGGIPHDLVPPLAWLAHCIQLHTRPWLWVCPFLSGAAEAGGHCCAGDALFDAPEDWVEWRETEHNQPSMYL